MAELRDGSISSSSAASCIQQQYSHRRTPHYSPHKENAGFLRSRITISFSLCKRSSTFAVSRLGRHGVHSILIAILLLLHARVLAAAAAAAASSTNGSYLSAVAKDITDFSHAPENAVRREGIDTSLRKYAFMALTHVRTGIIYNVTLPALFNGITSQAMRVRTGSTKRRGLVFNEFTVPQGAVVVSGGPFVVMVYRKIFNFTVYTLPDGYDFVAPVVGIVIYTSMNTSFDDAPLPEMSVVSLQTPITARVPITLPIGGNIPLCAFFDNNGNVTIKNVSSSPNVCSSTGLMDVSLVLPSSQIPSPPSSPPTSLTSPASSRKVSNVWKIVLGAVLGGIVGLALLIAIVVLGVRVIEKCKVAGMEESTDNEETLQTALIGHTRAPTAAGVRTRPTLETGSLHT